MHTKQLKNKRICGKFIVSSSSRIQLFCDCFAQPEYRQCHSAVRFLKITKTHSPLFPSPGAEERGRGGGGGKSFGNWIGVSAQRKILEETKICAV